MLRFMIPSALMLTLSACGISYEDRALSMGLAIGALGSTGGPSGAALGATLGVAGGTLITSDQVNLGEPVWNRPIPDVPDWMIIEASIQDVYFPSTPLESPRK